MQLLVVRHARAEDRKAFAATGQPDSERPLTAKGIRRMKKAARGLHTLVSSIDLLATSPLRRAVETARIMADLYGGIPCIERDELAPGASSEHLIDWLAAQKQQKITCIVGHEPDLSELLEVLVVEKSGQPPKLQKGSASLLKFEGVCAPSSGIMQWYRSAGELASLA